MELDGQVLAMLPDISIDAARISFKKTAVAARELSGHPFGHGAQAQDTLLLIMIQPGAATRGRGAIRRGALPGSTGVGKDLGHLASGKTAGHVYLPQPVLGDDVALGEEQIIKAGGGDVGHAVSVTHDADWGRKTRYCNL